MPAEAEPRTAEEVPINIEALLASYDGTVAEQTRKIKMLEAQLQATLDRNIELATALATLTVEQADPGEKRQAKPKSPTTRKVAR